MKKENKTLFLGIVAVVVFVFIIMVVSSLVSSLGGKGKGETGGYRSKYNDQTLEQMLSKVDVTELPKSKGSVNLTTELYEELPEIDKYPLAVEGTGDVDIEIFTSGEKAGSGNDSWLIDCASSFNREGFTTAAGKRVSISVRSVSSGLAADYCISAKYLPDLYTPSNVLFGDYADAQGAVIELVQERLVGNTAGLLIKKGSSYSDTKAIIDAVVNNEINIGYTNPQTSATGLNLLIEILKTYGGIDNADAVAKFETFNNNIPFVAYTTQQMRDSASGGSLDGMVTEYQAYINDNTLTSVYDFIPFGLRHDNPVYEVGTHTEEEKEAIRIVLDYLSNDKCQKLATEKGFNAKDEYKGDYTSNGAEVTQALKVYKTSKDSGKSVVAVFVADCSGSMAGSAITELQDSLSNGINYINEGNYIGLVTYSTDVQIALPIAQFDLNQKSYFQGAVNNMVANGNTSTNEAILVAVDMIQKFLQTTPDAKPMIFVLSDGYANGYYEIEDIAHIVIQSEIPIYTIGYTEDADKAKLAELSGINEAATISADSDDVIYKIKSLFNSQL